MFANEKGINIKRWDKSTCDEKRCKSKLLEMNERKRPSVFDGRGRKHMENGRRVWVCDCCVDVSVSRSLRSLVGLCWRSVWCTLVGSQLTPRSLSFA